MATKRDMQRLAKLVEGIDVAMFTTIGADGFPVSRPLSTQEASIDGAVLWFFVRRSSPKMLEIARDAKVNVAYASKDRNVYVSIAGSARVVDDQSTIDALWSDALKAYFRRGRKDPNLVLIRVDIRTVQYWEGPSSGIGKLIAFVAARVTGDDSKLGENRMIRLAPTPRVRNASRAKRTPAERATRARPAARKSGARKSGTRAGRAAGRKSSGTRTRR